ncbi:MAG: hypothetical protein ACLTYN_09275 [Dysosmobacter welbionis]
MKRRKMPCGIWAGTAEQRLRLGISHVLTNPIVPMIFHLFAGAPQGADLPERGLHEQARGDGDG